MIPAASSLSRRSARIFVAIPSPDSWNSLKVRNPRIIRSRMIRSDQRSPSISSEILTGQPDRCFALDLPGTRGTLPYARSRAAFATAPEHRHPRGLNSFTAYFPVPVRDGWPQTLSCFAYVHLMVARAVNVHLRGSRDDRQAIEIKLLVQIQAEELRRLLIGHRSL